MFEYLSKSVESFQVSLKADEYQVLYTKARAHLWKYLPEFFLEWEIFQTKIVLKIKTHTL
jgi:hypothetical protein